ncbi:P-loop containing nucleoside triphosphate hydrolase protein [Glomus cerebriforme]|uniref:P-loop containing nucleoside triphosphate hydrolase protein n=1 Tax=Glomus cerebriforme TaxID=658196 RepID=A0A397T2B5_9GLOM|nr:P-loop containing nucleoside triphosphate hydrolase protein [Glomus cerebriforme]
MFYSSFMFEHLPWKGVLKFHKTTVKISTCSRRVRSIRKGLGSVVQANMRYSSTLSNLRPYQKECIDTCLNKFLDHKVNRQIVSLPVGSGKTVIFSNLIKKIPSPFPDADKVLVLAHREELLDQAYNQIKKYSDLSIEIDQGGRIAKGNAEVILGSVNTLGRVESYRIEKYNPLHFKAIIIDEAHHVAASSYRRILEHFGADKKETHLFVWGCSATVRRYDGLSLINAFDEITYHKDFLDMIQEKWLCNLRVTTIKTDVDLSKVKSNNEDFLTNDLSKYLNVESRNDIIVRTYLELAAQRKSTLVFGVDISHVESLTTMFRKRGLDARGISSKTKPHIRAETLKDFKERRFPVLVNCGILTEGTDIPNIDCVIMSRPTKSPVLFQQMIGRGMRLSPEKEDCLVLDFIDSYSKIPDLVTTPTLLGLDPTMEMKDENLESVCVRQKEKIEENKPKITIDAPTKIHITEYNDPFEIIDDCSGAKYIEDISDNVWLRVGEDSYVISLQYHGTIKVEKENGTNGIYHAIKRKRISRMVNGIMKYYYEFENLPITSDSLGFTIRACDKWIKKKYGKTASIIASRYAKWRKQPLTVQQINWLKKKKIDLNEKKLNRLNKGQASNLMTKMIEGAGKSWKSKQKQKKKIEKKKKRERKRKETYKVNVGPLR